jgi:hypothetical protein
MLGVMGLDGGIEEKTPFGAFGGDLGGAFKNDKNQTSLDRLRNAMVDPDPAKRPTLDGVLMSSYLNDARDNYGDESGGNAAGGSQQQGGRSDMTALRAAISVYVNVAGKRITKLNQEISKLEGKLKKAQVDAAADPTKMQAYQALLAAHPDAVAVFQGQIDAIHKEPAVAKALDAVRKASEPFGTSNDQRAERAWDFAYNKTMKLVDQIGKKAKQPMPDDLLADIRGQPQLRTGAEALAANPPRATPLQPNANRT